MDGQLILGDCLIELSKLPDNSVDSLITDPPAGISFMGKDWDSGNNFIPAMTEVFKETLRVLKPGAHGLVWALPRTSHWTATALEQAGFQIRDVITHLFGSGFPKSHNLGGGRGTALKPASEHWILVRKKCSEKTVAANVLKHGTGGLNIEASRIEGAPRNPGFVNPESNAQWNTKTSSNQNLIGYESPAGRFPANLVLDEEAAEMLDEQSGVLKSGARTKDYKSGGNIKAGHEGKPIQTSRCESSQGGASRFFYVAKASKKDRGEDNNHPTVKSTKLMEYLITLITPPNGLVLDPFMGSGSTGKAAEKLGMRFIGIEKQADYYQIAESRIGAESNGSF